MSGVRSVTVHCPKCRAVHSVSVVESMVGLILDPTSCTGCGATLSLPVRVEEEILRENLRLGKRY